MNTHLLSGVRVIECASFVAGPSSGLALGQLGAQVIRIDPLGGAADYRRWPLAPSGDSLYWAALNKGKRSVAIDLTNEAGRELATALITAPGPNAGVFVDNSVGRRWLSHDTLTDKRADLIHVRVQGYADGRPAVDYTINAEVGVPLFTGPETTTGPINHVLPAWDLLTGMNAATGVLAALHRRATTGAGAYIELALADVAQAGVATLGWLAEAQIQGTERPRHGNHVYGSFGVDFQTRDGHRVMVVALTEHQWRALRRVTGTEDVFGALEHALNVDLSRESDRYRLRETIAAILRPWFTARTVAEVRDELDSARVLWSRYRSLAEVAAEHHTGESESVLTTVGHPGIGPVLDARSPLRISHRYATASPAPTLGQHTHEVLAEILGLTQAELGKLHEDGLIDAEDKR